DVDWRPLRRQGAEKHDQQGQNDEGIGPSQGDPDDPDHAFAPPAVGRRPAITGKSPCQSTRPLLDGARDCRFLAIPSTYNRYYLV
ncbi:hypothetical protein, partial [Escherichia coli]|uniref:hypothetical protein n=1 Tax=Escherichia coli TaxID=562 RepID=UPI0013D674BE